MENFDLRKYLAEGKLLKEDMTSKAVSILKSYKGEVKGLEDYIKYLMNTSDDISSSIQAVADDMDRDNDAEDSLRRDLEKLSLAEGKLLKEDSEDIAEMAYERDSVEDIVKRIKPILANHPQLKKQEDPEQYLIDFVTKRKRFINKNKAPIGKDKFARNIGTMPYDKYIKLQFNEYIYSTTP